MNLLRKEMTEYYDTIMSGKNKNTPGLVVVTEVNKQMDEYLAQNPDCSPYLLKAKLHETIAELFEPVIFGHSPFYYEMGTRDAMNWGCALIQTPNAGAWMYRTREYIFTKNPECKNLIKRSNLNIELHWGIIDADHSSPGYTKLLRLGLKGLLDETLAEKSKCATQQEINFIEACERSIKAVMKISEKFASHAASLINSAPDKKSAEFMQMIADTAKKVPLNPPSNFYEGLASLCFLREVTASLEGVGISITGHPDRCLSGLYYADKAKGLIDKEKAIDLAARMMLPTDIKFDLEHNPWPETSTTLMLGGCDIDGNPVYNEVSDIFLEAHAKHNLVNPKLNCRYSSKTPRRFLEKISEQILNGRNVFTFLNDDCLIEANVRAGKTLQDSRLYSAGGCQETVLEGFEHSAGAYYYFNLPKVLDICLNRDGQTDSILQETLLYPLKINGTETFDELYSKVMRTIKDFMINGSDIRKNIGAKWPDVNPAPFFSAGLEDCLQKHIDYTAGGTRYNPSSISIIGLATFSDSLYAVKKACFDEKWLSLKDLLEILETNWENNESIRQRFINIPKYGHGNEEADNFTGMIAETLYRYTLGLQNERGGIVRPNLFAYYAFMRICGNTGATPDGRKKSEPYSQGAAPGRLQSEVNITELINSMSHIDFKNFPGNSVVDIQLPAGSLTTESLTAYIEAAGKEKAPTIQLNCVDINTLKEAQKNPEMHRNIIVRICGLSAKFTALGKGVQDEIINRAILK